MTQLVGHDGLGACKGSVARAQLRREALRLALLWATAPSNAGDASSALSSQTTLLHRRSGEPVTRASSALGAHGTRHGLRPPKAGGIFPRLRRRPSLCRVPPAGPRWRSRKRATRRATRSIGTEMAISTKISKVGRVFLARGLRDYRSTNRGVLLEIQFL